MTRVVLELKAVDGGIDIAVERQYGSDATDEEKATALAMQVFFEDVGEQWYDQVRDHARLVVQKEPES